MRSGCSTSAWRRPRESRLRMAYDASRLASVVSSSTRVGIGRSGLRCPQRPWGCGSWLDSRPRRSLGDDGQLDGRADVPPDLDDDGVRAQLLDRLCELDAAAVDLEALVREEPLQVEIGDRPEQTPFLTGARLDRQPQPAQLLCDALGRLALALGLRADDALLVLEDVQILAIGLDGEAARKEIVPRVAGLHPNDLTDLSEARDVVTEDHFNGHVPASSGIARAV